MRPEAVAPELVAVIPVYRQPGFLPEAVVSALRQDAGPGIVIVSDGCPMPETEAICRVFVDSSPERIRYVRQENRGLAAARNKGIETALRHWPMLRAIYFLDADNRLAPHALSRMYHVMQHEQAAWVFPDLNMFGMPDFSGMAGAYSAAEHVTGNMSDAGSLVSRAVFDAGVRFDETLRMGLEDWDFWLQASEKGFRGRHAIDAGFQYRRRPESMLRTTARSETDVAAQVQRKHRRWATARRCVDLEHAEAPRYVWIDSAKDRAYFFTDARDRTRSMPLALFVERSAVYLANECFRSLPAFAIAGPESVFQRLASERVLVGAIWHMERACATSGWSYASASDVQAGLPDASASHLLTMASLKALLGSEERDGGDLAHVGRRLRAACASGPVDPTLRIASNGRRKESLAQALYRYLNSSALLPLFGAARRVGVVTSGCEAAFAEILRYFPRPAWTRHLFLISEGSVPAVRHDAVDTITAVPLVSLVSDGYLRYLGNPLPEQVQVDGLVDAVCTMDLVILHGVPAALPACAPLRERGCQVVYAAGNTTIEEWDGRPQALPPALAWEHALDGIIPGSAQAAQRLVSYGFPAAKLVDAARLSCA